jgi:hypothetical protein
VVACIMPESFTQQAKLIVLFSISRPLHEATLFLILSAIGDMILIEVNE